MEKLGKPAPSLEELRVFVGPPLMEQFMKFADLDEETARLAVSYYRERYSTIGIFENHVYPGIEEMLGELRKKQIPSCGCILKTGEICSSDTGTLSSSRVFS